MGVNILVLSAGTRNKIIQYFKKEMSSEDKIFAADLSELAPAIYEADDYFITPRVTDDHYLETVLNICENNDIDGILSLIDPELSVLSQNKNKFLEIGTIPILSDINIINTSFNKFQFNHFLSINNFNTIKSYIDIDNFKSDLNKNLIDLPVFVKPVTGSASININLVDSVEEIELLFNNFDNLLIQEFMEGKEYGVDVYVDLISEKPVSIFIKEKLKMRAGETDKSVSVRNDELFKLVKDFVHKAGYKGIIDIDIFEVNGKYYISEVNPRFGGGYPHAYECNINVPNMIINNLKGIINQPHFDYKEKVYMMKYNDISIKSD